MFFQNTNRRDFLMTLGILGGAAVSSRLAGGEATQPSSERLAIEGGEPVRKSLLSARPYGPQFYDDREKQELIEVLESRQPFRWWHEKSKVLQFEKAYAAHLGVKYALGVTSGTTALVTAMAALEVGPGDEVILPAWTWYADYDAIVLAGGLPVFAEVDESFNIDPTDIESKITPQTKAIIVCHLQGTPADLEPIMDIAKKYGLRVLEDFAQCVGGKYKGRYVGTLGDIGINSFQLSKTITSGEGGAVVTNDVVLFERSLRFHDVGSLRSPYQEMLKGGIVAPYASCNFRMSEFTGAVLKAQLEKLETICSRLRENARFVRENIADLPGIKLRKSPDIEGDIGYAVYIDLGNRQNRDRFLRALRAEGIAAVGPVGSVILPTDRRIEAKATVHREWPSFRTKRAGELRYGAECCPKTIDIINRFGGVIIDPNFTEDDLKDIVKAIRKVYLAMRQA